jgi:hypothetical protein
MIKVKFNIIIQATNRHQKKHFKIRSFPSKILCHLFFLGELHAFQQSSPISLHNIRYIHVYDTLKYIAYVALYESVVPLSSLAPNRAHLSGVT